MDRLQTLLETLSQKPAQAASALFDGKGLLKELGVQLGDVLPGIDGTIPFSYLGSAYYEACTKTNTPPSQQVLQATSNFLSSFDADALRAAPESAQAPFFLADVLHGFAKHMQPPRLAILPLQSALRRLQPRPSCLTPAHPALFQACLAARCPHAARPLLYEDVLEVDPQKTGLRARDVLLYSYYGGLLALSLKDLTRAVDLLGGGLSVPADGLSAIMVACQKKFLLASLLREGGAGGVKGPAALISRQLKSYTGPYLDLVKQYEAGNRGGFAQAIAANENLLRADGNLGLARQCEASLSCGLVRSLTQTYVTLGLEDIGRKVGLGGGGEAERTVLSLCEDGIIGAAIDHRAGGLVRFLPPHVGGGDMMELLDRRITDSVVLMDKVRAYDTQLSLDRSVLSRAGRGGGGGAGGARFDTE